MFRAGIDRIAFLSFGKHSDGVVFFHATTLNGRTHEIQITEDLVAKYGSASELAAYVGDKFRESAR